MKNSEEKRPEHITDDAQKSFSQFAETIEVARRLRRKTAVALGILATSLTPIAVVGVDIHITKEILSHTEPTIHSVAPALDPESTSATIFIDGFGSENGSWTAGHMVPAFQEIDQGQVWALEFDKEGIDTTTIANTIAEAVASSDDVSSVTLYGYSIGGNIISEVTPILMDEHGITVTNVVLDHTPIDGSAIRASQRDLGDTVTSVIDTAHAVGIEIEYSRIARYFIDQYYNDTIGHINSSTPLLLDQFITGISADVRSDLEAIADLSGTQPPTIIYISSADPSTDYMIDVGYSAAEMLDHTNNLGLPTVLVSVDGAIHSRLDLTTEEYETALADAVPEIIEANQQAYAIVNPNQYADKSPSDSSDHASREQDDQH